jgi:hypothetical protein
MSLDYGYGDYEERRLAEAQDDASEKAYRILHGLDEPSLFSEPIDLPVSLSTPSTARRVGVAGANGRQVA